jgi:hypothetical protein
MLLIWYLFDVAHFLQASDQQGASSCHYPASAASAENSLFVLRLNHVVSIGQSNKNSHMIERVRCKNTPYADLEICTVEKSEAL